MPLFMALVGYFAGSLLKMNFRSLLLKKGRQLLLPAITFGLIIFLISILEYDFVTGLNEWFSCLWFLKSAFICCIIYYVSFRVIHSTFAAVIISLLVSQVIAGFKVDLMYPCFLFGLFVNKNIGYIKENSLRICLVSGSIFCVMLLFWDASFWSIPSRSDVLGSLPDLSLAGSYAYLVGYRIVIGLVGTLFFISLFELISKKIYVPEKLANLSRLGEETLGIYLLQTLVLEIVMQRWVILDEANALVFNFIISPLIALAVLVLCHFLISLIKKSKMLSFLLLGKSIDNK